jgi:hypothetical protein
VAGASCLRRLREADFPAPQFIGTAALTVADGAEVLEGGTGRDLFFASLSDTVLNRRHDEILLELD